MTVPGPLNLARYIHQVRNTELLPWSGEVVELVGMLVASRGPAVAVGDFCEVQSSSGRRIRTQVIGFRNGHVLSMPLEEIDGIQLNDRVYARQEEARVAVGPDLIGRVLNGFGQPIDRKPRMRPQAQYRRCRFLRHRQALPLHPLRGQEWQSHRSAADGRSSRRAR